MCNSPGIAARTLANIADVLGCMAGKKGGLRSGPAANHAWADAFALLEVISQHQRRLTGTAGVGHKQIMKEIFADNFKIFIVKL